MTCGLQRVFSKGEEISTHKTVKINPLLLKGFFILNKT